MANGHKDHDSLISGKIRCKKSDDGRNIQSASRKLIVFITFVCFTCFILIFIIVITQSGHTDKTLNQKSLKKKTLLTECAYEILTESFQDTSPKAKNGFLNYGHGVGDFKGESICFYPLIPRSYFPGFSYCTNRSLHNIHKPFLPHVDHILQCCNVHFSLLVCNTGMFIGIQARLNFVKCDVQCKILYINSMYESNDDDHMVVVNHTNVDPLFGTMEDFNNLLKDAERNGSMC